MELRGDLATRGAAQTTKGTLRLGHRQAQSAPEKLTLRRPELNSMMNCIRDTLNTSAIVRNILEMHTIISYLHTT